MTNSTLSSSPNLLAATTQNGPLMEAELFPLSGQGRLRVTYNWLYSALNCDPSDASPFLWTLSRVDLAHVALSPSVGYAGMTLYASVRDDWNWYVEVQAAHSADWIRAVGQDETIGFETQDLMIVALKGFNGQFIAVDEQVSDHGPHAGYRLRSVGAANSRARLWFLAVRRVLQPGFAARPFAELSEADISRSYAAAGVKPAADEIAQLLKRLS